MNYIKVTAYSEQLGYNISDYFHNVRMASQWLTLHNLKPIKIVCSLVRSVK